MNETKPMDVDEAITSRQSCRRFLDRQITREQVHHLLEVGRFAPSGSNVQPWKVYAIGGEKKEALCEEILEDYHANGERQEREYEYYPTDWFEPYLERRRACGWGLYGSLGITREQKDRMSRQRARNYIFFGAPVGLVFTINRRLNTGSWMDMGMFLQSVMLAARGQGLHTCAQASFANYPGILRRHLGIPGEEIVVCGMAVGYGDMGAPENRWRTDRAPVESFTRWVGFD
jgi:nitroreductase